MNKIRTKNTRIQEKEHKNKITNKDRYMNNKNTKMTRIRIQEYE